MIDYDNSADNFNKIRNPNEVKLIERVVSGEKGAIKQLFGKHRKMFLKISRSNLDREVSNEKRIKIGNQGLLTAAKRYHDTNGFRFISYGYWWIRESISQTAKR